jgi:hypothetical protein
MYSRRLQPRLRLPDSAPPPGVLRHSAQPPRAAAAARFRSDVLPFAQMAEEVNRSLSLPASRIPSGAFNAMFDATRSLCFDARLVELDSVEAVRASPQPSGTAVDRPSSSGDW